MSLLTKFTFIYLAIISVVLGVAGLIIYNQFQELVVRETDYTLYHDLQIVKESIRQGKPIEALNNERVHITPLPNHGRTEEIRAYSDTLIVHYFTKKLEPFRKVTALSPIGDQLYRIEITEIFIEEEDMKRAVADMLRKLFFALSGAILLFSFVFSRQLLKPFRLILEQMERFTVGTNAPLELPRTNTREFRQLKAFVRQMADRARREYRALKEFVEHTSHEMQTPVAIAQGKMELLLQDPELKPRQAELVASAKNALARLSRLGKGLALLTKIEHGEYTLSEQVDVAAALHRLLPDFEELAQMKNIEFLADIEDDCKTVRGNATLLEILLTNLLKNAIQHNDEGGRIEVRLRQCRLLIRNTGKAPDHPPEVLFQRFAKGNSSQSNLGLGLAIARKICDASGYHIRYRYEAPWHEVEVVFAPPAPET